MSHFCFFTDADATGLLTPQDSGGAFGVVSDTEFRVTSLHTAASDPRVFAVCDGTIAVRQDTQANIVSLILKPKEQPSVKNKINFVPIRYIIYKGVVKDSLIVGSTVADRSKNQLTNRAHKAQDAMNRATEVLLEEPANSIALTPPLNLFGYDIAGSDTESLDKLFYKPNNSSFERLSVGTGDYIGTFAQSLFGLEIVLDSVRANATFVLTKHLETRLQAAASANSNSQLFKRRHQKEAAISFMDPCAFFGSFFQYGGIFDQSVKLRYRLSTDIIAVENETNDSDLHKAGGQDIYEKILVHFVNKNAVYLDIRNELNTSLNFYQHYSNTVKIKIPQADDEITDKDYYGNSGWPLLVLRRADFDLHGQNRDSDKDVVKLEISLPNPASENGSPVVYISQGYTNGIKRRKVLRGEKRYIRLAFSDDYTEPFSIAIPNIAGESTITPVSQYVRIKYVKAVPEGISTGIVPRASNYIDLLFLPFSMNIPFAITANAKSRVYQEDVFLSLSAESGCESAGVVGIAADTENVTLFAYAGDKLKTKGVTRLASIKLASEAATAPHYLNVLRDRYKKETLVQGKLLVGSLPHPSYLRFVKNSAAAADDSDDVNLRGEFIAIVIKKTTFAEMALDHGFSRDYDVFTRFSNEFTGADAGGLQYTRYDLFLEGYIDDGTSISLGVFDPAIQVFSFGRDHNLILLDKEAEYDALAPGDVLPQCTGAFDQKELEYLHDFIEKLKESATPLPFSDLYPQVFHIDQDDANKIEVKTDGPVGNIYRLVNPFTDPSSTPPPARELPKGFLAEACTVFTLYKLDRQLALDTQEAVDIDAPGKSPIYKALKKILINSGFKKPAVGAETLRFNEMMSPNRNIGERLLTNFRSDTLATKRKMYDLMVIGNLTGPLADRNFIFTKSLPLTDADVLSSIKDILEAWGNTIKRFVDDESACAYKILSGETVAPTNLFLATGDGSLTSGLLESEQVATGVLLFNYDYDSTAGVKETARRSFSSVNTDLSTAVHLTMFGLDFDDDSTVDVVKDGITYLFKAKTSQKLLRPISGAEDAGQAKYNDADKLFYKETRSGIVPLAIYDPARRDLVFIAKDRQFAFTVGLTSFHTPTASSDRGYEEVSVSINVIEGPEVKQFEFEAERLFDSDVFVLTPEQRDNLLAAPRYVEPLAFMIERLITVPNIPIRVDLRGNFVGTFLENASDRASGSKVARDEAFQFHKTAAQGRAPEVFNEADPIRFPRLKYSFGRVIITSFNIVITIDSFVSPQWSRLDKKVPPGRQGQLDSLTNYHTIAGSDAYIEPPTDFHASNNNLPKMPSYNPILSGLRSFGLAEALKEILVKRAEDSGADAFDVLVMKNYLETKLAHATVLQNTSLGIGADIEFAAYVDFKPQ